MKHVFTKLFLISLIYYTQACEDHQPRSQMSLKRSVIQQDQSVSVTQDQDLPLLDSFIPRVRDMNSIISDMYTDDYDMEYMSDRNVTDMTVEDMHIHINEDQHMNVEDMRMSLDMDVDPMLEHAHGIWLWYVEGTGFTHQQLAERVSQSGFKRVYIKVADGVANCQSWTELCDSSIPEIYQQYGLEAWAWSYNYPGQNEAQAEAITLAQDSGYHGYVLDIEVEFDGLSQELHDILSAFSQRRSPGYPMYVTTWGNPLDHQMRVDIIDQYVDAHMPQTYVEVWGQSYMNEAARWTQVGTCEYRGMGAIRPVHHIVSAEYDIITADMIRAMIEVSGRETSVWRIPGDPTPQSIWSTLERIHDHPISYMIHFDCP